MEVKKEVNPMATVTGRMRYNLLVAAHFDSEDIEQATPTVIQRINSIGFSKGLVHRDNPNKETLIHDCWDTDENLYIPEHIEALWKIVYRYAFYWCVDKMHSMK
jgi:hypothetical protein